MVAQVGRQRVLLVVLAGVVDKVLQETLELERLVLLTRAREVPVFLLPLILRGARVEVLVFLEERALMLDRLVDWEMAVLSGL